MRISSLKSFSSLFFLFLFGCQREVPEFVQRENNEFFETKSGKVIETKEDYGQFPSNSCFESDSLFPILQLKNNLKVKRISDSLYLFDGDILVKERFLEELSEFGTQGVSNDRSAVILSTAFSAPYWSGGVVPYKMDISLPPSYKGKVVAAISEISSRTPIHFKLINPSNNPYNDYIIFKYSDTVNNSYVGRQGGSQIINITTNNKGVVMHEIMHALGFFHEHSRADRDSYIVVDTANIHPNKRHNFDKYSVRYSGVDIGAFDFNSIMLYSSRITDTSFVYDTTINTMRKLDGSGWVAQRDSLSASDIDGVWMIYGVPPRSLSHSITNQNTYSYENTYYLSYIKHTTLTFYEDETCTTPQILAHPARLSVIRARTSYNYTSHQLETTEEVVSVTCPAGQSSYIIAHQPNVIYIVDNIPNVYDVTEYYLP